MKPKPNQRIAPEFSKVARYRRERTPKECESTDQGQTSHPSYEMGFDYPPEILAEPEYESDYDFEQDARERELLMDDLADDNDDFARSEEDGWYYSDEN